jgi:hypothetical protein
MACSRLAVSVGNFASISRIGTVHRIKREAA